MGVVVGSLCVYELGWEVFGELPTAGGKKFMGGGRGECRERIGIGASHWCTYIRDMFVISL